MNVDIVEWHKAGRRRIISKRRLRAASKHEGFDRMDWVPGWSLDVLKTASQRVRGRLMVLVRAWASGEKIARRAKELLSCV